MTHLICMPLLKTVLSMPYENTPKMLAVVSHNATVVTFLLTEPLHLPNGSIVHCLQSVVLYMMKLHVNDSIDLCLISSEPKY